jgi:hypothetical protein
MKFYLANCTSQVQTFNYRLPERLGGHAVQHIDVGRQARIAGELNQLQIDSLIAQCETYGSRKASDAAHYAAEGMVPMLYSIDKPVAHDTMLRIIELNARILHERGATIRKEAAIAASHGMRNFSPNAADNVALSVEEEKAGTMDRGGQQGLAEGFRMKVRDDTGTAE